MLCEGPDRESLGSGVWSALMCDMLVCLVVKLSEYRLSAFVVDIHIDNFSFSSGSHT